MNASERRNIWADRIERCLSSDMTIEEWCRLNHIGRSTIYKWMAEFRKTEPGRFACRSSMTSNWIAMTSEAIADARAIVPAAVVSTKPTMITDESIESEPAHASASSSAHPQSACPIRTRIGKIEFAIPPGTAESDIAAVMRAAMSL